MPGAMTRRARVRSEPAKTSGIGGDFRVHGVKDLRAVDASVFPRIPGFFIAGSVYMAAEEASDVILAAASCDAR